MKKTVPARIPENFFFPCVFWRNLSQECVFGDVAGIPVEWERMYTTGIPVAFLK
jgi:hypothetical protein